LKAGGAYLPLDPAYPRERLSFMLADAGAALLVTHSGLRQRLPGHDVPALCLDLLADTLVREPVTAPPLALDPHHPAYVIYTSGSTGTPKGVVVAHRNVVTSNAARDSFYREFSHRRFLLLSSIAFDSSVAGVFWSLLSGGTLILPTTLTVESAVSLIVQEK